MRQKIKDLKTSIESTRSLSKRFRTNDATVEKLAHIILENPAGLLVMRDELAGWLASLDRMGHEGEREFYLEAWNGYGAFTIDRIARGTLHLPALCLSIFGGIQPAKLDKYLIGSLQACDDGLLQRFQILLYPSLAAAWKNCDTSPDASAQAQAYEVYSSISKLNFSTSGIFGLRFETDAQAVFDIWRANLEVRLREGGIENTNFESHLAKYRSLVPSLALIFFLAGNDLRKLEESRVNLESVELAIKWSWLLELHAKKIYRVAASPQITAAKALAVKIKERQVRDGDSLRSVYRHHWAQLDTQAKLSQALKVLTAYNWLRMEGGQGSKRQIIRLNPDL